MPLNYIENGYQTLPGTISFGETMNRLIAYMPDGRVVFVADSTTTPVEALVWETDGSISLPGTTVYNHPVLAHVATAGLTTTLSVTAPSAAYQLIVTPHWNTTWWEVPGSKSASSVTVKFGTAPPAGATFDYHILYG